MSAQRSFSQRLARLARATASEIAGMLNPVAWFATTPKFELGQLAEARRFLDEHGWVIVRGVFSADEVAALREGVQRSHEEARECDLFANPHLGGDRFILHPRFRPLLAAFVGERPVHFGDASYAWGTISGQAFHKDNPDRQHPGGPDWKSPYSIVRFGVYLQDHSGHSGGLALRDASHKQTSVNRGRPFAAPTVPGDVVAWSLRTSHSGFATRLRGFPKVFVPLTLMNLMVGSRDYRPKAFPFRPLAVYPRMALFASFGVEDAHLRRFVRHLCTCDYAVRGWQATQYTAEMRRQLEDAGITLLDMPARTRGIDLASLHRDYVPLPDDEDVPLPEPART
jgi:hypothetical protein